ncbi:hypothetical protein DSO57_1025849 [Entomophthora muscae]|uniref:Uncharacterized protein n=1 Tax=Entomophthora muscae TaxID=34485 RepID=A0ACC2RT58_9FUNG|nr:hypothetical protein DSO57_1025849 [Entomophthora muscae]
MNSFALAILTSVLALGPCPDPTKESCLRGGASSAPCSGMRCPPCWIPQGATTWGCYEKAMGPDNQATCPPWAGIVDITMPPSNCAITAEPPTKPTETPTKPTETPTKPTDPPIQPPAGNNPICPDVGQDTCFQGGHMEYPCQGATCPPCWEYKNKKWDCYDPINGKCQWGNLIDIRNPPSNCQLPECE